MPGAWSKLAKPDTDATTQKKRPKYEIGGRDYFLEDVNHYELRELTRLLSMPAHVDPKKPPEAWMYDQSRQLGCLPDSLRRPRNIISRTAMAMGKKMRYFPKSATLCELHHDLDPRVIHNLIVMVGNEVTCRTDKYRGACRYTGPKYYHLELPQVAQEWVDRMDQIIAMRWGSDTEFQNFMGYRPRMKPHKKMRGIRCDACVLAFIGGDIKIQADLTASVRMREEAYKTHHRGRDPRLGRILKAWYRHFDKPSRKYINDMCAYLMPHLHDARRMIIADESQRDNKRRHKGKHSRKHKSSGHHRGRSHKHRNYSRPCTAPAERHEHADIGQLRSERTGRAHLSSRGSSKQTPMTVLPSPFEFQVFDETDKASGAPSLASKRSLEEHEDEPFPVSPLSEDDDAERARFDEHSDGTRDRPVSMPQPFAFEDDDAEFDDLDDAEDDEDALAEAWVNRRTADLALTEWADLNEALPPFNTYKAPSAIPNPLHVADQEPGNDEPPEECNNGDDGAASWYSATVHTYVPPQVQDEACEPVPRPSSSHYTSAPTSHHGSAPRGRPPLAWDRWNKRFVDDSTLSRLEGH